MSLFESSHKCGGTVAQGEESQYPIGIGLPELGRSLGANDLLPARRYCSEVEARQLAEQILKSVERERSVSLVTIETSLGALHWQGGLEDDYADEEKEVSTGTCHGAVTGIIEYVRALPFREREALSLHYGEVELSEEKAAQIMHLDAGVVREHVIALRAIVTHEKQVDLSPDGASHTSIKEPGVARRSDKKLPPLPSREEFLKLLAGTTKIIGRLTHEHVAATPQLLLRQETAALASDLQYLLRNVRTLGSIDYVPKFGAPTRWYQQSIAQFNEFVSILKDFRPLLRDPVFREMRPESTNAGRLLSLMTAEFGGIAELVESRHIRLKREPQILDAVAVVLQRVNHFVNFLKEDRKAPRERAKTARDAAPAVKKKLESAEPEIKPAKAPVEVKSVAQPGPAPVVRPVPQNVPAAEPLLPVTPQRKLASSAQLLVSTVVLMERQCSEILRPSEKVFALMRSFIVLAQEARKVFPRVNPEVEYSVTAAEEGNGGLELQRLSEALRSISSLVERLLPESEEQDKLRLRLECDALSGYCELHALTNHMEPQGGKSPHEILIEFVHDANYHLVALQRISRVEEHKGFRRVS